MTAEEKRLDEDKLRKAHWRRWGPYLSERQWGTVREDYSQNGKAWEYFTHDQARSRAYRWGEDGIGGISDNHLLPLSQRSQAVSQDDLLIRPTFLSSKARFLGFSTERGKRCLSCLSSRTKERPLRPMNRPRTRLPST